MHVLALCACVYVCVHVYVLCVCLCTCVYLHAFMCVCTCMCLLITENILLNTSITFAMTFKQFPHNNISGVIKKKVELKWENKIMTEVMCF